MSVKELRRMTCWNVCSNQNSARFTVYNQDTAQKNEPRSYTRLENMVHRDLDQVTKDRNFDARNDRTASTAPIRRNAEDRSKNEEGNTGGTATGKARKGTSPPGKPNQPSCFSYLKGSARNHHAFVVRAVKYAVRNVLGERSHILQIKDGMGSSIHLNRQS